MNDENIEYQVTTMTKTLYDPELEKRGELKKAKIAIRNMLQKGMDEKNIAEILEVDMSLIEEVLKDIKQ